MKHRIFIAINLPEDIKKQLLLQQSKWPELPIRWTKKENLHITLVFIGYVNEEELMEICKITKEIAPRNQPFLINLKKICYGPPDKKPPRMIWAEGEKSRELAKLQIDLENSLQGKVSSFEGDEVNLIFTHRASSYGSEGEDGGEVPIARRYARVKENRAFASHITLGRLKLWEFRQIEPEERPEVEEEISFSFEVNSVEIMESRLKPSGPDYFVLESIELGKK